MQRSALCRSRRELSNAYSLAKFCIDTAENEPYKVCQLRQTCGSFGAGVPRCGEPGYPGVFGVLERARAQRQTLQGPFSAVSKPIFARNMRLKALDEIHTMDSCAELCNLDFLSTHGDVKTALIGNYRSSLVKCFALKMNG